MKVHVWFVAIAGVIWSVLEPAQAARRVDASLRAQETMKARRELNALGRRSIEDDEVSIADLFQLTQGEDMRVARESRSAFGTRVERLQEVYRNIPVYDAVVTVRTDENGRPTGDASGTLIQEIDRDVPDITPVLSNEDLLELVIEAEGDDWRRDSIGDARFSPFIYTDEADIAHLVSEVSYLIDGVKRPKYIIDSVSGVVLAHWQDLDTFNCGERIYKAYGGNTRMGKIKYGDLPYCLNLTVVGDICYLENEYVRIVDMEFSRNESIIETASFKCKNGYEDEVNDAYSPAIDAFFYGTVVGMMYEDWFDTAPLEEKIVIRVHYAENYENAFWNGVNCTFGDGGRELYPLTSLDVVSHEIGHGVSEQGSSVMYYDEAGGINEAFSDLMGEAAEQYLEESDMLVGDDITKTGEPMRDFEKPSTDGSSIEKVSQMNSDMDPHFSSGIYRRVFFVVTTQKSVPIRKAAAVFLHANRLYWHHMSTFHDASCGVLRSAMDLGYSTTAYKRAFADVGISPCDVSAHVISLPNNITQPNVRVSDEVRPIFRFEMPLWADDFIVEATTSDGNGRIIIRVQAGEWEEDEYGEGINLVHEEENNLTIYSWSESVYFLQFEAADGLDHRDVQIKAGYTCLEDYSGEHAYLYRHYCGLD